MAEPAANNLDDLTDGWPDGEADRAALTQLAGKLREARPALSARAMERVGAALKRELDRQSSGSVGTVMDYCRVGGQDRVGASRWVVGVIVASLIGAAVILALSEVVTNRTVVMSHGSVERFGPFPDDRVPRPLHFLPVRPLLTLDEGRDFFAGDDDTTVAARPTPRHAPATGTAAPAWLELADRLVGANSSAERWVGWVQLQSELPHDPGDLHAPRAGQANSSGDLQALLCWRMLPLPPGEASAGRYARQVEQLRQEEAHHSWLVVFRAYLALRGGSRASLLAAASEVRASADLRRAFPAERGQSEAVHLLRDAGLEPASAGLEVLANRDDRPLFALLELDRGLTRAAADDPAHAATFEAARDALRSAYLSASRSVAEKCFALRLLGQGEEAAKLAARAQSLAWLHEPRALASFLAKFDAKDVWPKVVEPLLTDEVRVVDAPPEVPSGP